MRTFITFEFDKTTKEKIYEIQKKIKENSNKGRFKYIDNFHLTLKFLGETDENKINLIYQDLNKRVKGFKPIHINLNGIDCFGKGNIIRTIYIKCNGEVEEINKVAKIVDEITTIYGFKSKNRFTPHVTIAQEVDLKISFEELKNILAEYNITDVVFDKLTIMKSEQIGQKRVYTPIYSIPLR